VKAFERASGAHPALGQGVYTYADAEKILRLPSRKLRSWLQGYRDASKQQRHPAGEFGVWDVRGGRGFNFYTLMEVYVVGQLRMTGVPMRKIRTARDELARRFNTSYPFSQRGILSDGKKILVALTDPDADSLLTLDQTGQTAFREIVAQFCQRIDFAPVTDLALRYWPDGRDSSVVVDPLHSFGRPSIVGTNISTDALSGMVIAGESTEMVATLYKLDVGKVEDAVTFELGKAA